MNELIDVVKKNGAVTNNERLRNKNGTILFFLFLVFNIVDSVHDISWFYFFLCMLLVLLDSFFNRGGFFEYPGLSNKSLMIKLFAYMIAYQFLCTLVNYLYTTSSFLLIGLKNLIFVPITMLVIIQYFSLHIDWQYFAVLYRGLGTIVVCLGAVESFMKKSLFYWVMDSKAKNLVRVSLEGTKHFRSFVFFGHPIINGLFCLTVLTILFYMPYKNIIINSIMKMISIYAIIGSGAKSSWGGLTLFFVLYIVTERVRVSKRRALYYIGFGVLIVVFIIAMRNRFLAIVDKIAINISLAIITRTSLSTVHRVQMVRKVFLYLANHPFSAVFGEGFGIEKQFAIVNRLSDGWHLIDNQYATIALDSGLIGLGLYIAIPIIAIALLKDKGDKYSRMCLIIIIEIYCVAFVYENLLWKVSVFMLVTALYAYDYLRYRYNGDSLI